MQTENFAREWRDRSHQVNRTGYFPEALPNLMEIEDMMRHSNRITEGFSQIREVVIAQQNALSEQRARVSREDQAMSDYGMLNDDYKNYTGGDAKKRRGVSRICFPSTLPVTATDLETESCSSWTLSQLQPCRNA